MPAQAIPPHAPKNQDHSHSADVCVSDLVESLSSALESAVGEIHSVNAETKVLALNARIEAARAGLNGAAFSVVAEEIQLLSDKTSGIAHEMANRTREKTAELMTLIDVAIRGVRLSDLALVNIDLIDRNLYERTCDVRWWATDGSLVDALSDNASPGGQDDSGDSERMDARALASKRLGVILDAYTVYYDLVLCDLSGRVIANGRPNQFASVGEDQSSADWFRQAIGSASGNEYGFQSAHPSALVGGKPTLTYSCSVRSGGEASGRVIGALGILFNWPGLAGPILENIPVLPSERAITQAYILDRSGRILASNREFEQNAVLDVPEFDRVLSEPKGHFTAMVGRQMMCIGHARAPGFETYSTDWCSIVMQPVGQ